MSNNLIYKLARIKKFFNKKAEDINWDGASISELCGDKFVITIKHFDPIISEISFIHEGCILSKAVTNAILMEIENKSKIDAISMVENFLNMINNKDKGETLGENLLIFKKLSKFSSRKNCMLTGPNIVLNILKHEKQ